MSAQAASFRIPFSTSHTQIGRCLSLLFQLYFSRLRCRRGTCFLDNAVVISPSFQVPLIWAEMKTLHVYFFPRLATLALSVQPLKPRIMGFFSEWLKWEVWLTLNCPLPLFFSLVLIPSLTRCETEFEEAPCWIPYVALWFLINIY